LLSKVIPTCQAARSDVEPLNDMFKAKGIPPGGSGRVEFPSVVEFKPVVELMILIDRVAVPFTKLVLNKGSTKLRKSRGSIKHATVLFHKLVSPNLDMGSSLDSTYGEISYYTESLLKPNLTIILAAEVKI
jgi:hypothetical protein